MPTATVIPLSPTRTRMKGKQSTTTSATLRTLYHRAARAFLQRDLALAHSLLDSAFKLIFPPGPHDDPLFISHRKKWDILRITLETTVYSASRSQDLPDELQGLPQLSPQSFVSAAYLRSILLFTPSSHRVAGGDAGFLPPNVLTTLVYASLKVVCPDVGRMMIEDWLSKRTSEDDDQEEEGYEKVLELYVLQVLPKLEEWDYAERYLAYETESRWDTRQVHISSELILLANSTFSV
ncbi:hypothetical protein FISHEDRAFT_36493 [Fistulina hepatica ATCC 64428]|uniref:Uncharacterized protein n=1 Tax=Fistulina hepatica ATCC 64428 TaxID=1128425 RepID=A0A0D7AIQ0_9AGAR|nr:hypothetical protein FISHEDRAFT_36493 [Fistulina hepatica ATCC 64428]